MLMQINNIFIIHCRTDKILMGPFIGPLLAIQEECMFWHPPKREIIICIQLTFHLMKDAQIFVSLRKEAFFHGVRKIRCIKPLGFKNTRHSIVVATNFSCSCMVAVEVYFGRLAVAMTIMIAHSHGMEVLFMSHRTKY